MDWTLWQTLSSFDILTFITRVTTDNCHVGNTAQHSRLRLFLDSDFAGDFEDSAATFGGIVMYLRKSNVCSYKLDVQGQTSVSHRSTDSEVISLDAGLRMDGIPAVGLWDLAIEVLDFFFEKKVPTSGNRSRDEIKANTNPNTKTKTQQNEKLKSYPMWTTLSQARNLLSSKPSFIFSRTMTLWSRWSLKSEVRRWDTCPETTEFRWIGCLTESMWTNKIRIKYVDTKKTKHVEERQFHPWWEESSSLVFD